MDKRFSLVLDQQCQEIVANIPPQQRAEFVRNAIKHYTECHNVEKQLQRLEEAITKLEGINLDGGSADVEHGGNKGKKDKTEGKAVCQYGQISELLITRKRDQGSMALLCLANIG